MGFEKTVLVAVVCDGCGPDWWEGNTDTQPLFASRGAAIRELEGDYEWRITRNVDGSHHMLCGTCAGKADCARYGHRWFRMSADDDRRIDPTLHSCSRCSIIRRDDEPPPGHPDSMTVELSDEDEEFLAFLDCELDPDRANEAA
jgi:hypothetical protein